MPLDGGQPKLALIAGSGYLPRRVAEAARDAGRSLVVLTLDEASAVDYPGFDVHPISLAKVGALFDILRREAVGELVMAGKVHRPNFAQLRPDARCLRLLPGIIAAAAQGDDRLIAHIVGLFEAEGVRVVAPETLLSSLLATEGDWTKAKPRAGDLADMAKGFEVARAIGALDIGQGVVVADGLVLAVEAAEGTDAMLDRVAHLPAALRGQDGRRRGVLVKCAKPGQERRVDLPTIGRATVTAAAAAGLAGIGIEAGGSLVVDREETIAAADAAGLFILARRA